MLIVAGADLEWEPTFGIIRFFQLVEEAWFNEQTVYQ